MESQVHPSHRTILGQEKHVRQNTIDGSMMFYDVWCTSSSRLLFSEVFRQLEIYSKVPVSKRRPKIFWLKTNSSVGMDWGYLAMTGTNIAAWDCLKAGAPWMFAEVLEPVEIPWPQLGNHHPRKPRKLGSAKKAFSSQNISKQLLFIILITSFVWISMSLQELIVRCFCV